ncbi:unnamed protein product [Paramecium pentaurelia]|uniref:Uncharacterized protein n=1 Tax=Paramecium pentaurelia TaxID=43138 RepID=A0A8S1SJ66_9CILI|nr:unnamed protein product [Paramecium pentaurelia]
MKEAEKRFGVDISKTKAVLQIDAQIGQKEKKNQRQKQIIKLVYVANLCMILKDKIPQKAFLFIQIYQIQIHSFRDLTNKQQNVSYFYKQFKNNILLIIYITYYQYIKGNQKNKNQFICNWNYKQLYLKQYIELLKIKVLEQIV